MLVGLALCARREVSPMESRGRFRFNSTRPGARQPDFWLNSTRVRVKSGGGPRIGNHESSRVAIGGLKSRDQVNGPHYGISGDKLRQKHMHTSNYGHNGVPSVSRYAAALHKQRSRLHLGVLGVLAPKPRGATTDLGRDKGAQGPRYLADTYYVGKNSLPLLLHFFQLSVSIFSDRCRSR